ncbi:hypothetical protein EDB89DRAFT_1945944 [Lactarius sanguifluus]|nr:hypothetical protein EDB89DRAFT_1945944 [Lactarius sanguifluus]
MAKFKTSFVIARVLLQFCPRLGTISSTVLATLDHLRGDVTPAPHMTSNNEEGGTQSPSSSPDCRTPLDNSTRNLLELLPNELIAKILSMLHNQDLFSCTRVCRRMVDIIEGSALLQYHLELGRSGMEDGSLSIMSIPERRERLRSYNDAWKHLRWSTCIEIDRCSHYVDTSPGGILILVPRTRREGKLMFVRIPSILRGIPMRQWEFSFSFLPQEHALDPSEDILVVMECDHLPFNPLVPYESEHRFHFLSLTTGEPHPLAAISLLSESSHLMHSLDVAHFKLSIAQNYLAILHPKCELCVCNWKTGQIVLSFSSDAIPSMSFLPENRLLLATTRLGDLSKDTILGGYGHRPVLVVYDLDRESASQHEGAPTPIAVFSLDIGDEFYSHPMMKFHYHLNTRSYSDEVAVPFFNSPSEQLISLETNSIPPIKITSCYHILLIPMGRLTSHIDGAAADNMSTRYIPWKDWGGTGTGWAPTQRSDCFLDSRQISGSRFVLGRQQNSVDVWDFSRTRVAQLEPRPCNRGFLPGVKKQVALPIQNTGLGFDTVAISEDALICQHHDRNKPGTYLLIF